MPDFEELDNDPELTEEKLQEKLNQYAKAFEEEFAQASKDHPDNVEEYTRDFFKNNIHAAAAQIVWLANNSTSDSVRLRASQFVLEQALEDGREDGDPVKQLLHQLTKSGAS